MLKRIIDFIYRFITPMEIQAKKAGVAVGSNNFISSHFWSTEPYLISIGSNCQITDGVKMFTHGGGQVLRDTIPDFDAFGKIVIGDFVYIGNDSLIMPGVAIGDHVLVAAGSVVTKSIPSGIVVAGNPAKYVCSIEEYKSKNIKYNLNTKHLNLDDKRKILQQTDDNLFIKKEFLRTEK